MVVLQALTTPASFEKEFLSYIADPFPATLVAAVMTVLSSHAENEHYLGDEDQGFIYVSCHTPLLLPTKRGTCKDGMYNLTCSLSSTSACVVVG